MKRYVIDEGVDVRTLLGVKRPALHGANTRKAIKKAMEETVKDAFGGHMDAIEEYQNKNNTATERRGGIKRTYPELCEGISYNAFTPGGRLLMDRAVEGLRKAKDNLEMIIYGDQSKDEAVTNELIDMHRDVCKMLDRLPW